MMYSESICEIKLWSDSCFHEAEAMNFFSITAIAQSQLYEINLFQVIFSWFKAVDSLLKREIQNDSMIECSLTCQPTCCYSDIFFFVCIKNCKSNLKTISDFSEIYDKNASI